MVPTPQSHFRQWTLLTFLPTQQQRKPTSSFPPRPTNIQCTRCRAAIKEWTGTGTIASYTSQDLEIPGHRYHPKKHMKALSLFKDGHSISSNTRLSKGHIPLFYSPTTKNVWIGSTCVCGTGPENVGHFLFLCPTHNKQRPELKHELSEHEITFDRRVLHYFQTPGTYCRLHQLDLEADEPMRLMHDKSALPVWFSQSITYIALIWLQKKQIYVNS